MTKRRRRFDRPMAAELSVDDCFNPRELNYACRSPTVRNRKAHQLCKQIERVLAMALSECADSVLQNLVVHQVRPCPDTTRLAVAVGSTDDCDEVLERLTLAKKRLRAEVAASINRRKTPDLIFEVV